MKTLTIDTSPWLDLLDSKQTASDIEPILVWHKVGLVEVYACTRLFNPDTLKMTSHSQQELRDLLNHWKVPLSGGSFRFNISRLNGPDKIGPHLGVRSVEEWKRFQQVLGPGPTELSVSSVGNRLYNKIGDYDALRSHYASGRNVFVTTDTHDYLNIRYREKYRYALALVLMSPAEFVLDFQDC